MEDNSPIYYLTVEHDGKKTDLKDLSRLRKIIESSKDILVKVDIRTKNQSIYETTVNKLTLTDFYVGDNSRMTYNLLHTMIESEKRPAVQYWISCFTPLLWKQYLHYKPVTKAIYSITSYIQEVNKNSLSLNFGLPTFVFQNRFYDLNDYSNILSLTDDVLMAPDELGDFEALEKVLQTLHFQEDFSNEFSGYKVLAAIVMAYLGYEVLDENNSVLGMNDEKFENNNYFVTPPKKIYLLEGKFAI